MNIKANANEEGLLVHSDNIKEGIIAHIMCNFLSDGCQNLNCFANPPKPTLSHYIIGVT